MDIEDLYYFKYQNGFVNLLEYKKLDALYIKYNVPEFILDQIFLLENLRYLNIGHNDLTKFKYSNQKIL